MAKKLSKKEMLDFVVSEIEKVQRLLKKLFKQQLLLTDEINRLARAATPATTHKKPRQKSKVVGKKVSPSISSPKRPVLIQSGPQTSIQARASSERQT